MICCGHILIVFYFRRWGGGYFEPLGCCIRFLILVVLVLLWFNGLFHGLPSFARWVALMWSDELVMH